MYIGIDSLVKCPFWLNTTRTTISCEGVVGNTCMFTKFADVEAKKAHINNFCMHEDGGKCPMAISLYRKYQDE